MSIKYNIKKRGIFYFEVLILLLINLALPIEQSKATVAEIKVEHSGQDGYVLSGGNIKTNLLYTWCGDYSDNGATKQVFRTLTGINVGSIPKSSLITSATLYLTFASDSEISGNPALLNPYEVDHINFGPGIDSGDYSGNELPGGDNFYKFKYQGFGKYAIPCRPQVQYSVANTNTWSLAGSKRWFQTALRCSNTTTCNAVNDTFKVKNYEAGSDIPTLRVYYYMAQPTLNLKVNLDSTPFGNKIILNWNYVGASNYIVYRSSSPIKGHNINYKIAEFKVSELDKFTTTYIDEDIEYGKVYYYNVGYSTNYINYTLDSSSDKFFIPVIPPNDLGFYYTTEITSVYSNLGYELRSPVNNSFINSQLISAYQIKVYRYGSFTDEADISIYESSGHISEFADAGVLIDGITGTTARQDLEWFDYCHPEVPKGYVIFDLGKEFNIEKITVHGSDIDTDLKKISIDIAKNNYFVWDEIGVYNFPNTRGWVTNINVPTQFQKGQYVKVQLEEIYTGTSSGLAEVQFQIAPILEEMSVEDSKLQKGINLVLPYSEANLAGSNEQDLGVFFLNGNNWEYIGGVVDPDKNIISVNVNQLGVFGIFAVNKTLLSQKSISFTKRYLTPDNDTCSMIIKVNSKTKVDIKIYDISGKVVRHLVNNNTIDSPAGYIWNGKDDYGRNVMMGTYLYQVKFNNKIEENGMILIIR